MIPEAVTLALEAAQQLINELEGVSWPQSARDQFYGEPGSCPVDYGHVSEAIDAAFSAIRATENAEGPEIGEVIISEIVSQNMVRVAHPDPAEAHVFVWPSNAAEQLTALVEARGKIP